MLWAEDEMKEVFVRWRLGYCLTLTWLLNMQGNGILMLMSFSFGVLLNHIQNVGFTSTGIMLCPGRLGSRWLSSWRIWQGRPKKFALIFIRLLWRDSNLANTCKLLLAVFILIKYPSILFEEMTGKKSNLYVTTICP